MRNALLGLATAAIVASFSSGPAKAMTLGAPLALKPAADALNPIDKVRYCEFYDPEIGDYVVFWVPGPCLRYGMPGFDVWLGNYYYGHRHWRGRVSSRPWVSGRPIITGRGSTGRGGGIRTDRGFRTDTGRGVYRGGGTRGTVVGPSGGGFRTDSGRGGGQVFRGGGGRTMGGGGGAQFRTGGGGGGMRTGGGGGGVRSGGGGTTRGSGDSRRQ